MHRILTTNCFDGPDESLVLGIHETIRDEAASLGLDFQYFCLDDLTEAGLIEACRGYEGLIIGSEPFTRNIVEALAENLKIVIRFGVGFDAVDLKAAADRGIPVANTPGANSTSVAEHALTLILAALKRIPYYDHLLKSGDWNERVGLEISGRSVALLGFGRVARILAGYLVAMGCRVSAYDPYFDHHAAAELGVEYSTVEAMLPDADIVSLHLPHNKETDQMVDGGFLEQMKKGSLLINTARGALVDDKALVAALETGQLGGAGLDTFQDEPIRSDSPLLAFDQVILTPHVAASTKESLLKTYRMGLRIASKYFAEGVCENNLNPEYRKHIGRK